MKKPLKYIRLHNQDTFIPGVGKSLGQTLPINKPGIKMKLYYDTTLPNLVIMEINGNDHFIPITNVQIGSFDSVA